MRSQRATSCTLSPPSSAVASAFVAGEICAHSERIQQRYARLDQQINLPAVHIEPYGHFAGTQCSWAALGNGFNRNRDARG